MEGKYKHTTCVAQTALCANRTTLLQQQRLFKLLLTSTYLTIKRSLFAKLVLLKITDVTYKDRLLQLCNRQRLTHLYQQEQLQDWKHASTGFTPREGFFTREAEQNKATLV